MSKGERLERKADRQKSRGGMAHVGTYIDAANWYKERRLHLDAARCFIKCEVPSRVVDCYLAAERPLEAAKYLEDAGMLDEACSVYHKAGDEEGVARCWLGMAIAENDPEKKFRHLLYAFDRVAIAMPGEQAITTITGHWSMLVDAIKASRGSGLRHSSNRDEDGICRILETLKGHPFLEKAVTDLANGHFMQAREQRGSGNCSLIDFLCKRCKMPALAAKVCELGLRQGESYTSGPSDEDSERCWLETMSDCYVAAKQEEDAIEVYMSREMYIDGAFLMERLGRFQEALELWEKLGPANYPGAGNPLDYADADTYESHKRSGWEAKLSELRGKLAVRGQDKHPVNRRDSETVHRDLDQMFAFGEITKEEYERKRLMSGEDEGSPL